MLNPFLDDVIDNQGHFVPKRLSDSLHMPLNQLAKLVNVHRNTLANHPDSIKVQSRLGEVAKVVTTAAELLGDTRRAVIWFRHQPLSGFDGKTAEELVAAGHVDAVLMHLDTLRDGGYS